MLEVKQLSKKLLQVGPGFQKAGREGGGGKGVQRRRERKKGEEGKGRGGKGYKQESPK